MNGSSNIPRRLFAQAGIIASGVLALSGCAWTPRNAGLQQATSSPQGSSNAGSSGSVSVVGGGAAVDDGLVLIQGGTFTMGSPADEPWRSDDEVQHEVAVSDFYLSPTEVSQLEYNTLMGAGDAGDDVPVADVSWYDAIAYCNALSAEAGLAPAYAVDGENVTWNLAADGYRLPTEAEWEFACRAGTTGPFNLDHSISADEANYYGHYPYEIEGNYFDQDALDVKPGVYRGERIASASFAPNNWGLYDMHGNVADWLEG